MGISIDCRSCGQRQDLPEGYSRPHFRCSACGAVNDSPGCSAVKVPALFDLFKAEAAPATIAAPGASLSQAAAARELLLQGTDNELDRNPYTVHGDVPTAQCPECGKPIHEGVTICKHCGVDFEAKKRAEKTFQPVDRAWDNGWPLQKRVTLFAILQVINLAMLVAPMVTDHGAGLYVSGAIMSAVLQAFLVGTFDRLHLTRNTRGKVVLTQTWRFAFIARPPTKIRWQEHEGIRLVTIDEFDPFDWMMAAILALYAVVPAILFWWYVIRPEKYDVALCKDHGLPSTILCRTMNRARAEELATVIADVAVLPVLK